jgi:hypothetical protein
VIFFTINAWWLGPWLRILMILILQNLEKNNYRL